MKRFLIKLIATTLLLIIALSSFGCTIKPSIKIIEKFLDTLELEIEGYGLEYSEEPLELVKKEYNGWDDTVHTFYIDGELYSWWTAATSWPNYDQLYISKNDEIVDFINDANNETIKIMHKNIMKEKSTVCNNILNHKNYSCLQINGLITFDEKIFIYCGYISRGGPIPNFKFLPPMIFEYNYEQDTVKYAGYLKNFDYEKGYHYDKNNPNKYVYRTECYTPIEYMAKIVKTN